MQKTANYGWHSHLILDSKDMGEGERKYVVHFKYTFFKLLIFEYAYPDEFGYFIATDICFLIDNYRYQDNHTA
jgi:hypothetical protein